VREDYFALLILSKWEFSKEYVQTIKRLLQLCGPLVRLEEPAEVRGALRFVVLRVVSVVAGG